MEGIPSDFELALYAIINVALTEVNGPSQEEIAKIVYEVGARLVEGQKANFTEPDEPKEEYKPYRFRPNCQIKHTAESKWINARFEKAIDAYTLPSGNYVGSASVFKERKLPKKRKKASKLKEKQLSGAMH